jgi:hypothetical protein
MDDHAEQLAKHLLEVEGGRELLASRERELDPKRPPRGRRGQQTPAPMREARRRPHSAAPVGGGSSSG